MKIKDIPNLDKNHIVEYFISDHNNKETIRRDQLLSISAKYNLRIISFRQDYREVLLIKSEIPLVELCLEES